MEKTLNFTEGYKGKPEQTSKSCSCMNLINVKISIGFFMRLDQQTLKYTQKNTCPVMTKIILKK